MSSVLLMSKETLEHIFYYATALQDVSDSDSSSAYQNGFFLDAAEARRVEMTRNLQTRKAIMQICRGWRYPALKSRFKTLVIDAKCSETWVHANKTLTRLSVGQHVKKLELDAFDSSIVCLKSAAGILRQCRNVNSISLIFADDTRHHLPAHEFLLPAMQQIDTSSLEHFHCNFGCSFEQAFIIPRISRYKNLRTLSVQSAFGFGATPIFESEKLEMAHLSNLKMTTTKDILFYCMGGWGLPSLRDLSIFNLKSVQTFKKFFKNHGRNLRTLDVTYIEDNSDISSLNEHCPNLEEIVVSVDGIPYNSKDGVTCSLSHSAVKRFGICDISVNGLTVKKTMAVLDGLMNMLTTRGRFPRVREIRLLDFQRELWVNVPWNFCHAELWVSWMEKCEDRMIEIQAADGRVLSFKTDKLLVLESKDVSEYGWLSLHTIEI